MKRQIDTKAFPTDIAAQVRLSEHPAPIPIRATLVGANRCAALGITAHGSAPVLALCRALVAAGHDPRRPLHAYRGDVLALIVRSLADGAQLRVATHGVGFEHIPECTGGPPVRQNEPKIVGGGSEADGARKRQISRAGRGRRR
jgi:hypothetical protein